MLNRATQWRLSYADGQRSDWTSKDEADEQLAQWRKSVGEALAQETAKVTKAREKFIAETDLRIVSVNNPNPFQVEYRKPTLSFPDGTSCQLEEGTSEEQIREVMQEAAAEAHPDPTPSSVKGEGPELESRRAWEREFLTGGSRIAFPPILSWDHFFPMEAVAESLDRLAEEGWAVLSASEDRGIYPSDLAENRSAPLLVRYLLVRTATAASSR